MGQVYTDDGTWEFDEATQRMVKIGRGSTVAKSNQEPFLNHATSTYNILGFDAVADTVYVNDATGGRILRGTSSDAWQTTAGVTWSGTLGASGPLSYPTDVTYLNARKMIRFKDNLYLFAVATTGTLVGIWRSPVTSGNTFLSWTALPLHSFASLATALFTCFDADDEYLYAAEYTSQASFTPKVYRSADGDTWETVIDESVAGVVRHFHAIAPDPYNPGHVYITCGDGIAKTIQRSTDYGATWDVIVASSQWQAVEISFSADYVYFAGDSQNGIVWKMHRSDLTPRWVTPWLLKNIPVTAPAAVADQYYANAWYGAVDPSSGDYYAAANDASVSGNTAALFLIREGEAPILCSKFSAIQSPVFMAGGVVWCGKYRKILNEY